MWWVADGLYTYREYGEKKLGAIDLRKERGNMSEEPTLRDIKEQLEKQGRQTRQIVYLSGAMWGGSITFSALFLWISNLTGISFTINCLSFLLAGFAFFLYCRRRFRQIEREANEKENNQAEANRLSKT